MNIEEQIAELMGNMKEDEMPGMEDMRDTTWKEYLVQGIQQLDEYVEFASEDKEMARMFTEMTSPAFTVVFLSPLGSVLKMLSLLDPGESSLITAAISASMHIAAYEGYKAGLEAATENE